MVCVTDTYTCVHKYSNEGFWDALSSLFIFDNISVSAVNMEYTLQLK